jgi:putative drug exporter of the RND superfamily
LSTYLYRLARWCYGHRRLVLAGWLLVVVVVVTLSVLGKGTENDNITIPGTESQNVVNLLKAKIPAGLLRRLDPNTAEWFTRTGTRR